MRRIILGFLVGLALSVIGHAAQAQYASASQPLGNTPDVVLLNQGSGCSANTAPCATVTSPSVRFGQPVQLTCSTIATPFQYQECIDTSLSPPELKQYIGSTWWPIWTLSPSSGPTIILPIVVGTTPVSNGTLNCILYDNSNVLGCTTVLPNGTTIGTTQVYTNTGTQAAITVAEVDWNASSPAAGITFPLPASPTDHDCRTMVNNSQQYTYPATLSGNGKNIGPAGDTTISSYVPGPIKVCYSSGAGYWSQSL
jgi:hypothetical protein